MVGCSSHHITYLDANSLYATAQSPLARGGGIVWRPHYRPHSLVVLATKHSTTKRKCETKNQRETNWASWYGSAWTARWKCPCPPIMSPVRMVPESPSSVTERNNVLTGVVIHRGPWVSLVTDVTSPSPWLQLGLVTNTQNTLKN